MNTDSALHPENHGFQWTPVARRSIPMRRVSADQARSYDERGFFVFEDAIDRATLDRIIAEIDPIEEKFEEMLRRAPDGKMFIAQADGITFTTHLVKRSPILREFAASELFADLCFDLIGPDVRLYWDQAVYKKPGYQKNFP